MTPAQCRAARGLIDWTQKQLADAARVGVVTIRQFEKAAAEPRRATVEVVRNALESAGVIFVEEDDEGPGVRLRKAKAAISREAVKAREGAAKDDAARRREGGEVALLKKAKPEPITGELLDASDQVGLAKFFVWSTPADVSVIAAPDEQTAAELFLGHAVSPIPTLGQLPICFVQAAYGLAAPDADGDTVEYWVG